MTACTERQRAIAEYGLVGKGRKGMTKEAQHD